MCASQFLGWAFWDSLRGGVGLRENTGCQVRDQMLMFGRPRRAGEGEMMKYFAGWNANVRVENRVKLLPFGVGWDEVYW